MSSTINKITKHSIILQKLKKVWPISLNFLAIYTRRLYFVEKIMQIKFETFLMIICLVLFVAGLVKV